jgi:radical SAM family uncharacterized protein/radical SAM-linked protein
MREDIKSFITSVQRPGRYTGGESGSVYKDKDKVSLRMAFCFPDTYEIGMSNLGMRILCGVLNEMEEVWCERVYAPWIDMEEEMRRRNIPLFTHESGDAVGEFDIVAFTLQYELCYGTVLNMLDLAGIPLRASERGEDSSVILAGGPCAYNPEPMAEFVDIFSIGEGEEALPELAALYIKMKKDGTYTKASFLREASHLEGFYVPSLYDVKYGNDGLISSISPKYPDVPAKVKKRIIADLNNVYVPTDPVLPYIETVHDRITLEVFRGCIRGCRFCQAGFISRPVREKSPDVLCSIAAETAKNSGYDEISLSSLSISDYSCVGCLTDMLLRWTDDMRINLSLPSMRADSFTKELMDKISTVRSSTLTFAPEAGTQRLRDVINKNVTEEEILHAASIAFAAGKNQVKLYFMNGLPGETYEDIEGISALASHVVDEYYRTPERNKHRQPQVTLSVACFIPKPFTPFQWEGQNTLEELSEKQSFLMSKITDRKVRYNYHDAQVSRLEAVFARGDRRLADAMILAQREGVKFDAWEECFDYDKWMDIFSRCGVDPAFYANRAMADDEILPWDMIDCGVTKAFLLTERHRAMAGTPTPSCKDKCSGCGANSTVDKKYCRWCPGGSKTENAGVSMDDIPHTPAAHSNIPLRKVRVRFSKTGALTYVSHLDLVRNVMRALVKSRLPLWYTEGFNPKPKLTFASSLSVGCSGERELFDVKVTEEISDEEVCERLREAMPDGIKIIEAYTPERKFSEVRYAENEIVFHLDEPIEDAEALCRAAETLFDNPVVVMKRSKSGEKETDISPMVKSVSAKADDRSITVTAVTAADSAGYLNPMYVAQSVSAIEGFPHARYYSLTRKRLLDGDGVTEFR